MPALRASALLLIFLLVVVVLMPYQAMALRFGWRDRKYFPHRFHRFLCKLFGIHVHVNGMPVQDRGVLMIANHTSYFDILALSCAARVSFVAKAEVAKWPFFGTLARLQRTVFVDRARRSATGEVRDLIRDRILDGDALVLFPEGTSHDGNTVLPFKSSLLGAAEAEVTDAKGNRVHIPVQPVSVAYVGMQGLPMGREKRPLIAWYGDMDLVPHLWNAVKAGPIDVVIDFFEPMTVDTAGGRKALAAKAEALVRRGQSLALAGRSGLPKAPEIAAKTGESVAVAHATA